MTPDEVQFPGRVPQLLASIDLRKAIVCGACHFAVPTNVTSESRQHGIQRLHFLIAVMR
jgi:hypothetical protein